MPIGSPLVGHRDFLTSAAFSPYSHTLATASNDGTVELWNIADPTKPTRTEKAIQPHAGKICDLTSAPSNTRWQTATEDKAARLWDLANLDRPTATATLTGHGAAVRSVAFSSDGRTLATGSADKTARIWNAANSRSPPRSRSPATSESSQPSPSAPTDILSPLVATMTPCVCGTSTSTTQAGESAPPLKTP